MSKQENPKQVTPETDDEGNERHFIHATDGFDLEPVPLDGSFCIVEGEELIVRIRNSGTLPAPDEQTITRVDFRGLCKTQEEITPTNGLRAGEVLEVRFGLPCEACFDPDCEFYITVDANNDLIGDLNPGNNSKRGVFRDRKVLPDLVPDQYPDSTYVRVEGRNLYFRVRNQGKAIAPESQASIELEGRPRALVNTPSLNPGVFAEVGPVVLPAGRHSYRFKITVDVGNDMVESNEENNVAKSYWEPPF